VYVDSKYNVRKKCITRKEDLYNGKTTNGTTNKQTDVYR
jgi:hypothetical protein